MNRPTKPTPPPPPLPPEVLDVETRGESSTTEDVSSETRPYSRGKLAIGVAAVTAIAVLAYGAGRSGGEGGPEEESIDSGSAGIDTPITNDEIEPPIDIEPDPETEMDTSATPDNSTRDSRFEQDESFDENAYWAARWSIESEAIEGPVGDEATHRAMDGVTASLMGRIAATAQAENQQALNMNSPIQFINGTKYFIETSDGTIREIKEPIAYGIVNEGGGVIATSWEAQRLGRDGLALFYRHNDEWHRFTVSLQNDARWFSESGARLVGVAYNAQDGPSIQQGNIVQDSAQSMSNPLLISTDGAGPIEVPTEPPTHSSIEQIIDEVMDDPSWNPGDLLSLSDRLPRS